MSEKWFLSIHRWDRRRDTKHKRESGTPPSAPSSSSPPGPVLIPLLKAAPPPPHSQQLAPWFCPSLPLSCPCLDCCSSLLAVTVPQSSPHPSTRPDTDTETVIFLKCESGLVAVPKPWRDPNPSKRFLTHLAVSAPTLHPAQRMER